MPRIRTIKPEMFSDEKLAELCDATRFLFVGLISMADDFGRLVDSEKQIEAYVWPRHNRARAVNTGLKELASLELLARGVTASGQAVIQIRNWEKHQKVDHPRVKGSLPAIVAKSSRELRENLASSSRLDLRPSTFDLHTTERGPGDTREESVQDLAANFVEPEHLAAYSDFRRESKRPAALDSALAVIGRREGWQLTGAALADMHANGMVFNVALVRSCIARMCQDRSGAPRPTSFSELARQA